MSEEAFTSALGFGPGVGLEEALREIRARTRTEPELGRHLLPNLLPLATDNDGRIRAWALSCADVLVAASRNLGTTLLSLCEITRSLLRDPEHLVADQAIRLATRIVPVVFWQCCVGDADAALWDAVMRLKNDAIEVAATTFSDMLRIQSAKFLGMLAMIFSPSGPSGNTGATKANDISLDICPTSTRHPFLHREELEQEGAAILSTLLCWIPVTSANTASAIVSILGMLVRRRPAHSASVATTLLGYYVSPPQQWSGQRRRYYGKNLKVMLMGLFKSVGGDAERAADAIAALKVMGFEQEMAHYQSRQARLQQREAAANAALAAEQASAGPAFDVAAIPLELAVDLAVNSLFTISQMEFKQATAGASDRRLSIVGISSEVPPRKKVRISEKDPRHRDPRFVDLVQTQPVAPVRVRAQEEALPVAPTDTTKSIVELREALIKEEQKERIGVEQSTTAKTEPAEVAPTTQLTELRGPDTFTAHELIALGHECYKRMLSDDTNTSISISVWMRIVVRLAVRGVSSADPTAARMPYDEQLMQYILADMEHRRDLALLWLYEEWRWDNGDAYAQRVNTFLEAMLNADATSEVQFSEFLLGLPSITEDILQLVSGLCDGEESLSLGIDCLYAIALKRIPLRHSSLDMLLKRCIHSEETQRAAAIAAVKKLLVEVSALSEPAEAFAHQHLERIAKVEVAHESLETLASTASGAAVNGSESVAQEDADMHTVSAPAEEQQQAMQINDHADHTIDTSRWSEADVIRHIELYFALCSRKHVLLEGLFGVYIDCAASVQRVIRQQLYPLVKSMGMNSPALLQLLRTFPKGGETLALRILIILTDKVPPSARLVEVVKAMYQQRELDARFLIPIVSGLDKDEVMEALPKIINLLNNTEYERKIVREVLSRILVPSTTQTAPGMLPANQARLGPSELLVTLHLFDESIVSLRKAAEATQICFGEKEIFTAEVLAVVLQQLIDQPTLPTLFMRTVLQSVIIHPSLAGYVTTLLRRLVSKRIWTNATLWQGFIRCCKLIAPRSFDLLLQLPRPQLNDVLSKEPSLKPRLREYTQQKREQQGIRATPGRASAPVIDAPAVAAHTTTADVDMVQAPSATEQA
ncbi:Symplekin tight junction protein C terminal-domain-containing protein [Thamnocephalis sphaerospora]|uniref:Symplekin tight junction protein C terminal-domain-containing protein n=1 Tax=Thamnocephalis sphaerospora TaxID=78915 RepID=A0A4P9XXC7_9FUNG|nr:Symplekin tight junction protein C terminal-domain-containing protein [Thamnocephalis sphaerospora]|eukprot:RKP11025.1 Symplekin tight junction protein C terminal-domain-containing protein [Thamnocephalis sphaerospora]